MDSNLIAAIAVVVVVLLRFVFGGKKKTTSEAGVQNRRPRTPVHSGDWIESTPFGVTTQDSGTMPSQSDPALEGASMLRQNPPPAPPRQSPVLRRPADMRSAVIWGELLRRKF